MAPPIDVSNPSPISDKVNPQGFRGYCDSRCLCGERGPAWIKRPTPSGDVPATGWSIIGRIPVPEKSPARSSLTLMTSDILVEIDAEIGVMPWLASVPRAQSRVCPKGNTWWEGSVRRYDLAALFLVCGKSHSISIS